MVATVALATVACGTGTIRAEAPATTIPTGGVPVSGGTVTWAELPSAAPNFIYPFMPSGFFSVANVNQFQYMMYRPLYWFGGSGQPTITPSESLADAPVYSNGNTTVTIVLKHYLWSDGETVDATDIMGWMNMWHAEKTNWAGYVPGMGMPDDVTSVKVISPNRITIELSGSVSPPWFTDNMLSQITPLPEAWDVTHARAASGSGGCGTGAYGKVATDAKCAAVWNYMNGEAGYNPKEPSGTNNSLATYATNPLWQVVDGPWHLASFDQAGRVALTPNPDYSGPVKPTISEFVEMPFSNGSAELAALQGGQLTMGYLPIEDVDKAAPNPLIAGSNLSRLSADYYLVPFYAWSINYVPYNFDSAGDGGNAGMIFRQLYFRQAMQYLVDQPRIIKDVDKGYGVPTYGPVPVEPDNPYVSPREKSNPYPYDPQRSVALLESHGWKVVPHGVDTCIRPGSAPGECGAGVARGARLDFDLQYVSGPGFGDVERRMSLEASSWSSAGIRVNLNRASFDTVIGNTYSCAGGPNCTWELQNWGTGWTFDPDFYPTGNEIFSTGALANYGSFTDSLNDHVTEQTVSSGSDLVSYQDHLAEQLPVIFQDNPAAYLWEIDRKLRGVVPLNPFENSEPEDYFFVK